MGNNRGFCPPGLSTLSAVRVKLHIQINVTITIRGYESSGRPFSTVITDVVVILLTTSTAITDVVVILLTLLVPFNIGKVTTTIVITYVITFVVITIENGPPELSYEGLLVLKKIITVCFLCGFP